MTAKLLDVSPDEYHRLPGLSASIAATVIARSPLHAWTEHPCFGGVRTEPTDEMDRGSVVHRLVLGAGKAYDVHDFRDWRTKDAREARDASRAKGAVPILLHKFRDAETIAEHVRAGLAARGLTLDGTSEVAIVWAEDSASGPVACRGMMDHVFVDRGAIVDLKIVSDASPHAVERAAENMGYAIQHAAYTRALARLRPELAGRVDFLFAFAEAEPPYAVNVCRPDGTFRELGERRWLRAVETWGACLAANSWPAYGDGVNTISPPGWALSREEMAA